MEKGTVAAYCRVDKGGSAEMQRETLKQQKQELTHYAEKREFQILRYYEDDGFPGHDLNRPGLTQMIEDCHAGIFKQVLVVNRSRLYRGNRWDEPLWPFQVYSITN